MIQTDFLQKRFSQKKKNNSGMTRKTHLPYIVALFELMGRFPKRFNRCHFVDHIFERREKGQIQLQ